MSGGLRAMVLPICVCGRKWRLCLTSERKAKPPNKASSIQAADVVAADASVTLQVRDLKMRWLGRMWLDILLT